LSNLPTIIIFSTKSLTGLFFVLLYIIVSFASISSYLNDVSFDEEIYNNLAVMFGNLPDYGDLTKYFVVLLVYVGICGIVFVNILIARLSNQYTVLEERQINISYANKIR